MAFLTCEIRTLTGESIGVLVLEQDVQERCTTLPSASDGRRRALSGRCNWWQSAPRAKRKGGGLADNGTLPEQARVLTARQQRFLQPSGLSHGARSGQGVGGSENGSGGSRKPSGRNWRRDRTGYSASQRLASEMGRALTCSEVMSDAEAHPAARVSAARAVLSAGSGWRNW